MDDNPVVFESKNERLAIESLKTKTTIHEHVEQVTDVRSTLLDNNPNRINWSAINEGGDDVRLSTDATITGASGWLLQRAGGVIMFRYDEDGEGTGYAVYAISPVAGPTNVRVREVIAL